ncbi:type VII toxin-antitoxin system MntA family adenylyltransferase antitoxin [Clostridium frigidicarnis]|uniref:Nucleotidyltransferase domain-containing protein n=1 Tax=Clostridium frigidicarnis TaxID=84698 RepID=A0A1I0VX74_9CLOT|nr:nucleotidyltransferase domain-containing protein [Clostridium frigidicarnis]SFA81039.1 Nucleotidyltransferase domain-containing protein [Clostridium frigidicarnis]
MVNLIEVGNFIKEKFEKYNIKFAYIFGSLAKNKANNMSDIDIAVMFNEKFNPLQDAIVRGEIVEEVKFKFNMPCDVVSLNKASTIMKYNVVQEGVVIIDDNSRADFESLALREYWDFKPYSDYYDEMYLKSIKEN